MPPWYARLRCLLYAFACILNASDAQVFPERGGSRAPGRHSNRMVVATRLEVAQDGERRAAGGADRGASGGGQAGHGEGRDDCQVGPRDGEVGGRRVEDPGEYLDQHLGEESVSYGR